jgi:hypothetical protein
MKTVVLDNVLSQKELYYMYGQIISNPGWKMNAQSMNENGYIHAPMFLVKTMENEKPENYPLFLWGQTLVFRIVKLLEEKNIGIPTKLSRMWFNSTFYGKKTQHKLHFDEESLIAKSILLFMTPIWQPEWRGSFYVDGEEFKFKPGSAVIFDSKEYHKGESPESETYNWQRLTCNIVVEDK